MNNIKVSDVISGSFAVATEDGQKIYLLLENSLSNKRKVNLDFEGIHVMTTAFLNAAIGQLYSKFTTSDIKPYLNLINVVDDDKILFKIVTNRAKEYFAQRELSENNSDEALYGKD